MRGWLRQLFKGRDRFDPSAATRPVPETCLREYKPQDRNACVAIYNANEKGRFPEGYLQEFADALDSGLYLWIVIEYQSEIVAVGGICLDKQMDSTSHLTFGMVHPDWHGKGLGTALLFARLAALPRPDARARIFMSSIGSSVEFYKRFGFTFFGRAPLDDTPREFDIYYTVLDRQAWQMLHSLLNAAALEIDLERIAIPSGP